MIRTLIITVCFLPIAAIAFGLSFMGDCFIVSPETCEAEKLASAHHSLIVVGVLYLITLGIALRKGRGL